MLASVARTGKALVLHEDTRTAGFGAEIAATIGEEESSRAWMLPWCGSTAPDTPVPFSPPLETALHRPGR